MALHCKKGGYKPIKLTIKNTVMEVKKLKALIDKSEINKNAFEQDPLGFIEKNSPDPSKNKKVYILILSMVGAVLLSSVWFGLYFINEHAGEPVPEFIISLSSTALGALVGLLAPSPK